MASVKDIRAKLLAKAAKRPVKGGAGDPVDTFKNTANTQIENVKKAIKKRDNGEDFRVDFNSRSDWYVGVRGGYGVSFGRFRPKIDGEDYFVVDDLEEVIETIEMAIELADDDKDFQNQIIAASDAIKAQLAKGKGSTKRK